MARSTRASSLETRTARLRLAIRKKPYTVRISPSLRLGYRRNQTAGVWSVIAADGKGGSWMRKFAVADDFEDSDRHNVLTFWEAQKQARVLARGGQGGESDPDKPATIREAINAYERDLSARGGMTAYPKQLLKVLPPALLAKPVALVSAKELSALRDHWAADMKPASVNRIGTSLKAALTLAASRDPRIINAAAWKIGLKVLPDAHVARNVILSDDEVRAIIAEAYSVEESFGLFVEILAVTGARVSQAARLDVGDLQADRLMMPSSAKGRATKRHNRVPVPIPPRLAARLRSAAAGRSADALLLVRPGYAGRWQAAALRKPFAATVKAAGLDPAVVTPNALRHSSIVRELLAGVPIRLIAVAHDTSTAMIERSYSKHIAGHSDAVLRRALLDVDARKAADTVVPLSRT